MSKTFKYYKVYCDTCKLLLCEECPTFHIKHDLSKKPFIMKMI